jgi:hypothetical protein
MRGISTIPAPSLPLALDTLDDPVRPVLTDPVRADAVRTEGTAAGLCAVATETACGASGFGAVPQTSQ